MAKKIKSKKIAGADRLKRTEKAYQEYKLTGSSLQFLADKYDLYSTDLSRYISKNIELHK